MPSGLDAGPHDGDGLRQALGVEHDLVRLGLRRAAHQRDGLGDGGRLVQQRRVRGGQAGQVGDHGLEVEQRFEPALGDLRLVGRVRGVPGRVLEDVAADHAGGDGVGVAEADHLRHRPVARGEGAQLRGGVLFGRGGREPQVTGGADGARHGRADEGVQAAVAALGQHLRAFGLGRADVAGVELRGSDRELLRPGAQGCAGNSPSVMAPESFTVCSKDTARLSPWVRRGCACFPEWPRAKR